MSTWPTVTSFKVPSASRRGVVRTVTHTDGAGWACNCPWEQYRRNGQKRCSHIVSIEQKVGEFAWQVYADSMPTTYLAYYAAQYQRNSAQQIAA